MAHDHDHSHDLMPRLTQEQTQAAITLLRDLQQRGILLSSTVQAAIIVLLDNLLQPDMTERIEQVNPERRGRLRTIEDQMKAHTVGILTRGREGLLALSDEEFDAMVEEANQE